MTKTFDWAKNCAYDEKQKSAFHREARSRLKVLAEVLGLPDGSYDLRSNKGGIAVSGEVTLHAEHVYIQASQPVAGSPATGLLIRACEGRRDFTGGRNHFASLMALDSPKTLAAYVLRVSPSVRPDLESPDEGPAPLRHQGL